MVYYVVATYDYLAEWSSKSFLSKANGFEKKIQFDNTRIDHFANGKSISQYVSL